MSTKCLGAALEIPKSFSLDVKTDAMTEGKPPSLEESATSLEAWEGIDRTRTDMKNLGIDQGIDGKGKGTGKGKGKGQDDRPIATNEGGTGRAWEDMTTQALVDIFARVSFEDKYRNVALVCKAWRTVVQEPTCWAEVDMEPSFQMRGESAQWWSPEFEKCMESMIKTVVDWGSSHLRLLRTRHCSDHALKYLSDRCPNLKCLDIQMSQSVTDESMNVIASSCPLLESVDLSECRGLSAEALLSLGKHCKGLTLLKRNMMDIDGNCRLRSIIPLRYLQLVPRGDQEGVLVAKCMPQLRHLEMCHSTIRDQSLVLLCTSCPKLEFLDLYGCSYLTGRGLDEAERNLPNCVHFRKPVISERNPQPERYGHWQLYDNRFSHQYFEF